MQFLKNEIASSKKITKNSEKKNENSLIFLITKIPKNNKTIPSKEIEYLYNTLDETNKNPNYNEQIKKLILIVYRVEFFNDDNEVKNNEPKICQICQKTIPNNIYGLKFKNLKDFLLYLTYLFVCIPNGTLWNKHIFFKNKELLQHIIKNNENKEKELYQANLKFTCKKCLLNQINSNNFYNLLNYFLQDNSKYYKHLPNEMIKNYTPNSKNTITNISINLNPNIINQFKCQFDEILNLLQQLISFMQQDFIKCIQSDNKGKSIENYIIQIIDYKKVIQNKIDLIFCLLNIYYIQIELLYSSIQSRENNNINNYFLKEITLIRNEIYIYKNEYNILIKFILDIDNYCSDLKKTYL